MLKMLKTAFFVLPSGSNSFLFLFGGGGINATVGFNRLSQQMCWSKRIIHQTYWQTERCTKNICLTPLGTCTWGTQTSSSREEPDVSLNSNALLHLLPVYMYTCAALAWSTVVGKSLWSLCEEWWCSWSRKACSMKDTFLQQVHNDVMNMHSHWMSILMG